MEQERPCTMFVSSSDFEGISNSMLEAMGMGLPVVVTDCPVGGARTGHSRWGQWITSACRGYENDV